MKKDRKRQIAIYVVRRGLDEDPVDSTKLVDSVDIDVPGAGQATLYIRAPTVRRPRWLDFFPDESGLPSLFNASSSALLLVPYGDRQFAITFGHGRHLLRVGSVEENFGLRVTLNAVSSDKIRSIDKETFDSIASQTREQAIRESPIGAFVLDAEQDVLRAVVGRPDNPADGDRLAGRDALLVSGRLTLANLASFLERFAAHADSDAYAAKFPWVDRVREERDPGRRIQLDEAVVDKLVRDDLAGCYLAVPTIIDWERVEGFHYLPGQEDLSFDLRLAEFLAATTVQRLDARLLRAMQVEARDAEGLTVEKWPLYRCLNAEIHLGAERFLLSNGKWYRLDADFVMEVDSFFKEIPEAALELPAFREKGETETDYNFRAAQSRDDLALVDRKLISYRQADRIEFCDLFSLEGHLIHVKRYGGSSVLSHLFAQGLVAASLMHEEGFRQKANEQLPVEFHLPASGRLPADRYEVVYAIVSQSAHPLWIPFFSRVNLRQTVKQLQQKGFRVAIMKIPTA